VEGLVLERDIFVIWDRQRVLPTPARLLLTLVEGMGHGGDKAG
jgi:hypothetical protein